MRLMWALLLAGCGRIAFDPIDRADALAADALAAGMQHASGFVAVGTTVTVPLPREVAAGSLLIIAASAFEQNAVRVPTDSLGNTFALLDSTSAVSNAVVVIYGAIAQTSGPDVATCELNPPDGNLHCHVYEVPGVTNQVVANGNSIDDGPDLLVETTVPVAAGDFIFAYFASNNSDVAMTGGPGYGAIETTISTTPSGDSALSEVRVASSAGTVSATAMAETALPFVNEIIALRPR